MKVEVFILTHKEINEFYDETLYKPILTGAIFKDNPYHFLTDDTGDNISELNEYYGELTGEYWVWKNIHSEIIGFTHRRRWLVKNFKFDKITKEDILDDLADYDIILPRRLKSIKTLYQIQKKSEDPYYDVDYIDYVKVEKILDKYFPEYAESYKKVMNGRILYSRNMFICKHELADEYFNFYFSVLDKLMNEIDLEKYENRDKRIGGFISERLLTTFVFKNKLKVKEYDLYQNDSKYPYHDLLVSHFPILCIFVSIGFYLIGRDNYLIFYGVIDKILERSLG